MLGRFTLSYKGRLKCWWTGIGVPLLCIGRHKRSALGRSTNILKALEIA